MHPLPSVRTLREHKRRLLRLHHGLAVGPRRSHFVIHRAIRQRRSTPAIRNLDIHLQGRVRFLDFGEDIVGVFDCVVASRSGLFSISVSKDADAQSCDRTAFMPSTCIRANASTPRWTSARTAVAVALSHCTVAAASGAGVVFGAQRLAIATLFNIERFNAVNTLATRVAGDIDYTFDVNTAGKVARFLAERQ